MSQQEQTLYNELCRALLKHHKRIQDAKNRAQA